MKRIVCPLVLLLVSVSLQGQGLPYDAAGIPADIKDGANAVIRNQKTQIMILKPGDVRISYTEAITILNPRGKYDGAIRIDYNKSRPLQAVSAALYDGQGRLLRRYKKGDFEDVSTVQDFSLFEDDRQKQLMAAASSYPYTVQYAYTQKYKFTFYLPYWLPVDDYGVSVEHASCSISSPSSIPLRYKGLHAGAPQADSSARGTKTFTWRLENVKPFAAEPFSPPLFRSDIPVVILSPARFAYYGMKGSFYNWKQYGLWSYEHLLKGRDELPETTVAAIRSLTDSLSSPEEKARKIYQWARNKNRYVSIQIGKGGFEPMTASKVDEVSYGDCKALVNYMMALLEAIGIPSYYTEVEAGEDPVSLLPHFASAGQGNHVILCVPFGGDTTWLECTDTHIPFGFLGSFTDDRNVLVITPEGGVLTRTPSYPDSVNRQSRTAWFVLDSAGDIAGKMHTVFEGLAYQKREGFETLSKAERIKEVKARYPLLQMNVTHYGLSFDKKRLPLSREQLSFTSPRFAALSQGGFSFPLNPVNRYTSIPPMVKNRRNAVYIARGRVSTDTLHYAFPSGLKVSFLPRDVGLRTPFGDYTMQVRPHGQSLTCIRSLKIRSGVYPAKSYGQLLDFLRQVSAHDQADVILTAR